MESMSDGKNASQIPVLEVPEEPKISDEGKAGADRVLACDLHSGQSMGYFDIPVDYVYCQPVILDYLASKSICSSDLVVVSPDVGGVARARAFAKNLSDAPLAIVDKMHHGHNVAEVMNLIGDVKGKVAVMVDDMIDTAGESFKMLTKMYKEEVKGPNLTRRLLNESPSDDKSLDLSFSDNGRRGTFTIGDDQFPASLFDLPCIVESHKTYDDSVLIKTADVGQMIMVKNEGDPAPEVVEYRHGLTPPMRDARRIEKIAQLEDVVIQGIKVRFIKERKKKYPEEEIVDGLLQLSLLHCHGGLGVKVSFTSLAVYVLA
ncbi:ribose-phosphate pyrophosphokinase 1-like protein [Tanacetum coccineum]